MSNKPQHKQPPKTLAEAIARSEKMSARLTKARKVIDNAAKGTTLAKIISSIGA